MHQSATVLSVEPMNEQLYMARFESMRKKNPGSSNKHIIVVHKELDRQCQTAVAKYRSDTRFVTSELRRQRQSVEGRRDRLEKDRQRTRRDDDRNRRYLTETEKRHHQLELSAAVADGRLPGRTKSDAEKRNDSRTEAENVMRSINRMMLPPDTKHRLHDDIVAMYGYLWD